MLQCNSCRNSSWGLKAAKALGWLALKIKEPSATHLVLCYKDNFKKLMHVEFMKLEDGWNHMGLAVKTYIQNILLLLWQYYHCFRPSCNTFVKQRNIGFRYELLWTIFNFCILLCLVIVILVKLHCILNDLQHNYEISGDVWSEDP
jgi:hypothetical protein